MEFLQLIDEVQLNFLKIIKMFYQKKNSCLTGKSITNKRMVLRTYSKVSQQKIKKTQDSISITQTKHLHFGQ